MKLRRQALTISVALVMAATADHAEAQMRAGTYPCATVTINAAGQITAINPNPCVQLTMSQLRLYSGGGIALYTGGDLLCGAC